MPSGPTSSSSEDSSSSESSSLSSSSSSSSGGSRRGSLRGFDLRGDVRGGGAILLIDGGGDAVGTVDERRFGLRPGLVLHVGVRQSVGQRCTNLRGGSRHDYDQRRRRTPGPRVSAPSASDDDGPVAERSSRCRAPCVDLRRSAHTLAGPNPIRERDDPPGDVAGARRGRRTLCGWRAMGCVAARAFKLLSPAVTTAVTSFFAIRRGFQKVRLGSSKETRKNQGSRTLDRSIPIRSNRVERHSSGGRFGPLQNSHHRRKMKTVGDPGQTNYTATAALHDHATAPGLFLLLPPRLFRLRRQLR